MKKAVKSRLITAVVSLAMLAGMVSAANNSEAEAAKKAKLGFTKANMTVGQKKKITIKNKTKKAVYTYKSSAVKKAAVSKSGVITAKKVGKATITVKEKLKKMTVIGKIRVTVKAKTGNKNAVTASPIVVNESTAVPTSIPTASSPATPTDNQAGSPTTAPTTVPTAAPTPDVYSKEVFAINMENTDNHIVDGATCTVKMQYFDAEAEGDYFSGSLKRDKESSIVTKSYKENYNDGKTVVCGRYILTGKNSKGQACDIFIEDNSIECRDDMIITKPTIITSNDELKFLQTADLQGRIIEDEDGNCTLHIMWNEDNDQAVPFPEVVRPDNTKDYSKALFTFTIGIGASDNVAGADGVTSSMINFSCTSDCEAFKGSGVSNFVDTRMQFPGQVQTLSARYIMEGTDDEGKECSIYVENNGIDDNGMVTEPIIITDNPKWAFIETAPLHGTVSWSPGLTIHMWTTPDAR